MKFRKLLQGETSGGGTGIMVRLSTVRGALFAICLLTMATFWKLSSVTLARHELITQMVLDTAKVLEDNEVAYWVGYGTALGAHRDGGVIGHDGDADFNILGDRAEMERAFGVLKRGLPVHLKAEVWCPRLHYDPALSPVEIDRAKTFAEWDEAPEVCLSAGLNFEVCEGVHEVCHNPDIDVYPTFVDGDTVWRGDQGNITGPPQPGTPWETRRVPHNWKKEWVLPLVKVPFGPGKVYAPRSMKALLEDQYGPSLRKDHIPLVPVVFPGVFVSQEGQPTLFWLAGFFWGRD